MLCCRGTYGKVQEAMWLGMPVIVKTLDIRMDEVRVVQVYAPHPSPSWVPFIWPYQHDGHLP